MTGFVPPNPGLGSAPGVEKRMAELLRTAADLIERGVIKHWRMEQQWGIGIHGFTGQHTVLITLDASALFGEGDAPRALNGIQNRAMLPGPPK